MKLLLLGRTVEFDELVTLVHALEGHFSVIDVIDVDGYNTILCLDKEKSPSAEANGEKEEQPP